MQSGFAKWYPHSTYFNYTQNVGANCGGYSCNVIADIGDSVVFEFYVVDDWNIIYYPYKWYFNGDTIPNTSGQQFLSVIINQSGIYSALGGVVFFMSYFYVNNLTGIPSLKNINSFNVYPTTVTSSITIQFHSVKPNDIEISFFDMNGRQLKTDFYKNISGEFIKNENTEALSNGFYFLRIKTGDGVVERKFVKM